MGLAEAPLESFPVEVEGDSLYVVAQSALSAAELFVGISDATLAAITALARRKSGRPAASATTSAIPPTISTCSNRAAWNS